MPPIDFITHARTLEELRDEFVSDIERRLQALQTDMRRVRPNATEATRITRVIYALQDLQDFWRKMKFEGKE
jgi:hypothetical protein